MTREGVDYSWGRPDPAALVAAGKTFAVRYLAYHYYSPTSGHTYDDAGKGVSAAEIGLLHSHGLDVVLNFESTAGRAKLGRAAGIEDAKAASAAVQALKAPAGIPVYFSIDVDTTSADWPAIEGYFAGVNSVLGLDRTGAYGEASILAHLRSKGLIRWLWQTYAWSGGVTLSGIHLKQYLNGQKIGGAAVDLDRAYVSSFGQWPPTNSIPLPESDTEEPVGLDVQLLATVDPTVDPLTCFADGVVSGDGHAAIDVSSKKVIPLSNGTKLGRIQKAKLPTPLDAQLGWKAVAGDRSNGWQFNLGGTEAFMLATDVADTPVSTAAQQVAAATAPLNSRITALTGQVSSLQGQVTTLTSERDAAKAALATAATDERKRIATAEANRITAL